MGWGKQSLWEEDQNSQKVNLVHEGKRLPFRPSASTWPSLWTRTCSLDTPRSPHLANLPDSDTAGSFATPHKHRQLSPWKLVGLLPSKLAMNSNLNKCYKSHLRANRKFKLLHVWEPKCCWNKREAWGQGGHCALPSVPRQLQRAPGLGKALNCILWGSSLAILLCLPLPDLTLSQPCGPRTNSHTNISDVLK